MNQYTVTVSDGTLSVQRITQAHNHKEAPIMAAEDQQALAGLNETANWTVTITQP